MRNVIYISTVGIKKKIPNIGNSLTGLSGFRPNDIHRTYILAESNREEIIRSIVSSFPILEKRIDFFQTDPFDYQSTINAILQISKIHKENGLKFIVNLTGGTKIMALGAFMGANLIGARIQYIKEPDKVEGFDDGDIIDIKIPSIPINQMNNIQKLILFVLNEEHKDNRYPTQTQLKQLINTSQWRKYLTKEMKSSISAQLVSYHCEILENEDILKRTHDVNNRRAYVLKLTEMGRILANFLMK